MTARGMKQLLNDYISKLVWKEGESKEGFKIFVSPDFYEKAKYSCTTEEQDFKLTAHGVTYKGFDLKAKKW